MKRWSDSELDELAREVKQARSCKVVADRRGITRRSVSSVLRRRGYDLGLTGPRPRGEVIRVFRENYASGCTRDDIERLAGVSRSVAEKVIRELSADGRIDRDGTMHRIDALGRTVHRTVWRWNVRRHS